MAAFFNTPVETDDAGLMAFLILKMFQAVFAQCPAVANTSSVASPALSPNLIPKSKSNIPNFNNNLQDPSIVYISIFAINHYLLLTILVAAPEVAERACFSATSAASKILSAVLQDGPF